MLPTDLMPQVAGICRVYCCANCFIDSPPIIILNSSIFINRLNPHCIPIDQRPVLRKQEIVIRGEI